MFGIFFSVIFKAQRKHYVLPFGKKIRKTYPVHYHRTCSGTKVSCSILNNFSWYEKTVLGLQCSCDTVEKCSACGVIKTSPYINNGQPVLCPVYHHALCPICFLFTHWALP